MGYEIRTQAPMLVIGLGGTGGDAVININNCIKQRFNLSLDANGEPHDPLTEYLVFDTDEHVRERSYRGMKLPENDTLRILRRGDTGDRWYENKPYITEWLNGSVPPFVGRAAGRLAFFRSFDQIYYMIAEKLHVLRGNANGNNTVQVKLIGSTFGGTGSGMLIDMAYIIRDVANNMNCDVTLDAYLLMPDAFTGRCNADGALLNAWNAATAALIKETEQLMQENGTIHEQYYADNRVIPWHGAPFERVFLQGGNIQAHPVNNDMYAHNLNVIAEYIADSVDMASEGMYSTEERIRDNRRRVSEIYGDDAHRHVFTSIGMSGNADELRYAKFAELNSIYEEVFVRINNNQPSAEDTENFIKQAGCYPNTEFFNELRTAYRMRHSLPEFFPNDPNELRVMVLEEAPHNRYFPIYRQRLTGTCAEDADMFADMLRNRFRTLAEAVISDPNRGIDYFGRLVYAQDGLLYAAKKAMEFVCDLRHRISCHIDYALQDCNEKLNAVFDCGQILWILRRYQLYDEYKYSVERLFRAIRDLHEADALARAFQNFNGYLQSKRQRINDCCSVIAEEREYVLNEKLIAGNTSGLLSGAWINDQIETAWSAPDVRDSAVMRIFASAIGIVTNDELRDIPEDVILEKVRAAAEEQRHSIFASLDFMDVDTMAAYTGMSLGLRDISAMVTNDVCPKADDFAVPTAWAKWTHSGLERRYVTVCANCMHVRRGVQNSYYGMNPGFIINTCNTHNSFMWMREIYGYSADDMHIMHFPDAAYESYGRYLLYKINGEYIGR